VLPISGLECFSFQGSCAKELKDLLCGCMKVRIDNKEHAKYVENQVAGYIWKVIVYSLFI
jgi:hypothetical protein